MPHVNGALQGVSLSRCLRLGAACRCCLEGLLCREGEPLVFEKLPAELQDGLALVALEAVKGDVDKVSEGVVAL